MTSQDSTFPRLPDTERTVILVDPQGRRTTGHLSWSRLGIRNFRVTLDGPTGRVEATDRDYFDALAGVRRQLEPQGWSIAVQGARRDTFPSGMLRDGGSHKVYVQKLGQHVQQSDLVSMFDDADPADLATVDEQEQYFHRWRESVFGAPGSS